MKLFDLSVLSDSGCDPPIAFKFSEQVITKVDSFKGEIFEEFGKPKAQNLNQIMLVLSTLIRP